ncbi:MAG TPA: ATPase domain-containing protein [Blastocatellia bacterium]|nr:ATPase domain-containing protein [Blastocatellia bacterium]
METINKPADPRVSTGVAGLDVILGGGLPRNHVYLLEGNPGTGKTTIALQFLLEGRRLGETSLYITLSETRDELLDVALSHGWSLDGIHVYDLALPEEGVSPDEQYTLFHPAEVELGETTKAIFAEVERLQPTRVILDSLSEMRLQARDPLRYRRQILALKQFFIGKQSTVYLLDDHTAESSDRLLESIVHGVIMLDQSSPGYGASRRNLFVSKLRGVKYRSGYHNFNIETGGVMVHPRLETAGRHADHKRGVFSSNVAGLDALTGGGFDAGTATLILGPAGSGKSTLAMQYAYAAAERGDRIAIFAFEESPATLLKRTSAIGIDLEKHLASGCCTIRQIDPAELSAGEFSFLVRQAVEQDGAAVVIIDSVNGYFQSMPEEGFLTAHMHELLSYLGQQGVLTIMILAQHGIVGSHMIVPVDLSYLADSVLLLRYFEAAGEVRQALSVIKKRTGNHERSIREFRITSEGIEVGEPLRGFQGVLTGVPEYLGGQGPLLTSDDERND